MIANKKSLVSAETRLFFITVSVDLTAATTASTATAGDRSDRESLTIGITDIVDLVSLGMWEYIVVNEDFNFIDGIGLIFIF